MSKKIIVKYGKEQHDITVDPDETFESLQGKIYCVTTVQAKNMRILNKGSKVVDDKSVLAIKDGSTLTILGTKESDMMEKIEMIREEPKLNQAKEVNSIANSGSQVWNRKYWKYLLPKLGSSVFKRYP